MSILLKQWASVVARGSSWSSYWATQWYGVEIDESETSPDVTRIASDMDAHKSTNLPVHNLMKGCLLNDDGTVNYYLNPDDWTKKADGTVSNLDGTDGQVMIEVPEYYRKVDNPSAGVYQHKISTGALAGFTKVNKFYIGAYKAVLERSTSKLCSVINTAVDYRGGDNTDYDADAVKTLRGKAVTGVTLPNFRTYARNRSNNRWNVIMYKNRMLLYELFFIEHATLNSQKDVDATLTVEGYKKGGLGAGVTTATGAWLTYNGTRPIIPIGTSNSIANGTGEVEYVHTGLTETFKVNRYRGLENPFGDLYELTDGINIYASAGGDYTAYVCNNADKIISGTATGYTEIGVLPAAAGYISGMSRDDNSIMMPVAAAGDAATYYCDQIYRLDNDDTWRVLLSCKDAGGGVNAGFGYFSSHWKVATSAVHVSSRLMYLPPTIAAPILTLTKLSETSVKADWTVPSFGTVTGYKLERSLDGINYTEVEDTASLTYTDSGLLLNTIYYRVKAYSTVDSSLYDSETIVINDSALGDGNTNAFYDATDESTLTISGTDVTKMVCKIGVGPDMNAASGTEPQAGTNEITFDGTEFLKSGTFNLDQPFTVYMKVNPIELAHADRILELNAGGSYFAQICSLKGCNMGTLLYNAYNTFNEYCVIRLIGNGASSSIQINEAAAVTGNAGTTNMAVFTIAATAAGGNIGKLNFKGLIIRSGVDNETKQGELYDLINAL